MSITIPVTKRIGQSPPLTHTQNMLAKEKKKRLQQALDSGKLEQPLTQR